MIVEKKLTLKEIQQKIHGLEPSQALEYLFGVKDKSGQDISNIIEKYTKKLKAFEDEKKRFNEMRIYEIEAYNNGIKYIAGIDEAGRGPLAGPVVAAAVILPQDVFIENLKDSKKLTYSQREKLFDEINKKSISYGIGIVDEKSIDEINILNATKIAMKKAVLDLFPVPDILFIDAVYLNNVDIKQKVIKKGDNLSISIAAASILAKVTRDRIIEKMDSLYPVYGFAKNKGYGTKEHIDAIKKYGICPIHRLSFVKRFI